MSRSSTFAAFSSSRQMMMAWKVSGFSQRPAIIASRPASMRLAMAISPSRDRSSTEPISRRYMRTGSSVRSEASRPFAFLATAVPVGSHQLAAFGLLLGLLLGGFRLGLVRLVRFDDVDAHVGEHRHRVFDLLGGDLLGGEHGIQLVDGDVAALLRLLDHLLDGGVGEIEQRSVVRLGLRVPRPWCRLRSGCLSPCDLASLSPSGQGCSVRNGRAASYGDPRKGRLNHAALPCLASLRHARQSGPANRPGTSTPLERMHDHRPFRLVALIGTKVALILLLDIPQAAQIARRSTRERTLTRLPAAR